MLECSVCSAVTQRASFAILHGRPCMCRCVRHLDADAFIAALGVSKDEFEKLPAWRQLNLKKRASLF